MSIKPIARPPNEKEVRAREVHIYCDFCDARLGSITMTLAALREFRRGRDPHAFPYMVLRTRYRDETPDADEGLWKRQKGGGFKGLTRGRDMRRGLREAGLLNDPNDPELAHYTSGRHELDKWRTYLGGGKHTVICFECNMPTRIEVAKTEP